MFAENSQHSDGNKEKKYFSHKFPLTHTFVYKSMQFKMNLHIMASASKVFDANYDYYQKTNPIIFEGDEDGPDVSNYIQAFIDYCHFFQFDITDDNVVPLNYLSHIYDVEFIKDETNQYINQNMKKLAPKILHFNINSDTTQIQKEIIGKNLQYYIQNNKGDLLELKINIIYDILSIYKKNTNQNVEDEQIINFIFACLDEKGRDASILFTFVDFGEDHMKLIGELIDNYESVFDFNFLKE